MFYEDNPWHQVLLPYNGIVKYHLAFIQVTCRRQVLPGSIIYRHLTIPIFSHNMPALDSVSTVFNISIIAMVTVNMQEVFVNSHRFKDALSVYRYLQATVSLLWSGFGGRYKIICCKPIVCWAPPVPTQLHCHLARWEIRFRTGFSIALYFILNLTLTIWIRYVQSNKYINTHSM